MSDGEICVVFCVWNLYEIKSITFVLRNVNVLQIIITFAH